MNTLLVASAMIPLAAGSIDAAEADGSARPVKIVAFGDSTTAKRGSATVYLDCLERDLPQQGIEIVAINSGIGGNTTVAGKSRFTRDVLDHNPDLVIIQFGINDSTVDVWKDPPAEASRVPMDLYVENLAYFLDTLKKQGTQVILMVPNCLRWTSTTQKMYGKPPYDPNDPDGFNATLRPYTDCVRRIAQEFSVPLIDVYAAFQEYGAVEGQSVDDLLSDGMHLNNKGHQLVANLLAKKIGELRVKE